MKLTRRTSRMIAIATAVGVLGATAVAPTPASAGIGGIDIGGDDRFAPVLIDDKPCDDEQFKKYVCSPDYVASIDTSLSYRTYYRGEKATVFTMYVHNDSSINGPDDLTSAVSSSRAIVGLEHMFGNANWSASPDPDHLGTRWTIAMPDGLDADDYTTIRVYVSGWEYSRVQLKVNGYWGYDCCGAWFYFKHLEQTIANNQATEVINELTKK